MNSKTKLRRKLLTSASRAALTFIAAAPLGVMVTTAAPQQAGAANYTVAAPLYTTLVLPGNTAVVDGDTVYVQADIAVGGASAIYSTLRYVTIDNKAIVSQTSGSYAGIALLNEGAVINAAGATISGIRYGVQVGQFGRIENSGTIVAGAAGEGVRFGNGGYLINQVGGVVYGGDSAVVNFNLPLTLKNYGEMTGRFAVKTSTVELTNSGAIVGSSVGILSGDTNIENQKGGLIQGSNSIGISATSLTLTNYGSVLSASGKAVELRLGTVTNKAGGMIDGETFGIYSNSGLAVTTDNLGTIEGDTTGIHVTGPLTLTNSGVVLGGSVAVYSQGDLTLTNDGQISSVDGTAVIVAGQATITNLGGTIMGANGDGIKLVNGGTLYNRTNGIITGGLYGVVSGGTVLIENEGLIEAAGEGQTSGVRINRGTVTNVSGGTISGFFAINALSGNGNAGVLTLYNGGFVDGSFSSVSATDLTVTNEGSIGGATTTFGVNGVVTATVKNLANGTIQGAFRAVGGGLLTLTNYGRILSASGEAVELVRGTVTNEATGVIDGGTYGIYSDVSTQTVTVENLGSISGGDVGVKALGTLLLTNFGNIVSAGGGAVYMNQGSVANEVGGAIQGGTHGLFVLAAVEGQAVAVENRGTIQAGDYGVHAGGEVALGNSGTIRATDYGGTGVTFNLGVLTNRAGGVISGYSIGVQANSQAVVVNEGEIVGLTGVYDLSEEQISNSGTIGDATTLKGVFSPDNGTVLNSAAGIIQGRELGVHSGQTLTLTNDGQVLSAAGKAVVLGEGTVTNNVDAVIEGGTVGVFSDSGLAVTVSNAGGIAGGEDGIEVAGALVLTNSGRITSVNGNGVAAFDGVVENRGILQGAIHALLFGAGDSSLVLDTGSTLYGAAVSGGGYDAGVAAGGEGFDSLTLRGTGVEDAEFQGFEVLTVEAGADWSLSAFNSSFSQSVRVDGRLALEGGALAVPLGSALSGSGTLVSGAGVTFESGSFLTQTVGDGAAELLTVEGGVVTVESGANVALTVQGFVETGESFTLLTSVDGIDGAFTTVEDNSERLEFSVATEGESIVVTVEKDALVIFAATPNQQALSALLTEAEAAGGNGLGDVIAAIDASADVDATLDLLSGDFHASTTTSGLVSAQSFLEGVAGRVGAAGNGGQVSGLGQVASLTQVAAGPLPSGPGAGFGAWAALDGTFGTLEDENAGDTDYDSFGGTVGGDFAVMPNLFLGAAVGFAVGSSETADRGATADSTVIRLAGYGRWFSGPISVTGALGASFGSLESERATPLGIATGETDATAFGFAAEGRYALALGGFTVSPLAGVSFTTLTQDAFEESGAGAANLSVGEATADSFRASLGAVASKAIRSGGTTITPEARLVYRHEFADGFGEVSNSFLADATATSFTVIGAEPAADVVEVGAGVTAELANGMSLFGDLGFTLGDGQTETNVAAGLRMSF